MSLIVRYEDPDDGAVAVGVLEGRHVHRLPLRSLADMLGLRVAELRSLVDAASQQLGRPVGSVRILSPVDEQEVWAAGVTYWRSRAARLEESGGLDLYAQVYVGVRPELFFKCVGWRAVGDGATVGVRRDARWSVPEPEVVVVANRHREIVGYTIGDDVSSRDIEGDNPLYLPQAKVYTASCAVGPGIRPAWELPQDPQFEVRLAIERNGELVMGGSTNTGQMVRGFRELVDWLFAALEFPAGVLLMTGTGIVPSSETSLVEGDVVVIEVDGVGLLRNTVTVVGDKEPVGELANASAADESPPSLTLY